LNAKAIVSAIASFFALPRRTTPLAFENDVETQLAQDVIPIA
jgi:hypothetical protein